MMFLNKTHTHMHSTHRHKKHKLHRVNYSIVSIRFLLKESVNVEGKHLDTFCCLLNYWCLQVLVGSNDHEVSYQLLIVLPS